MTPDLDRNYREIVCDLCRQFYNAGWLPGTGGGLCVRNGDSVYMTPSGIPKERTQPDEVYVVNKSGHIMSHPNAKPSFTPKLTDCSPLFLLAVTKRDAGAVLHSHSPCCNLITALFDGKSEFRLSHQEMIKAIKGHGYKDELVIPIIENTPHEHDLTDTLAEAIVAYPKSCAVLVRRHGMYVWGDTWEQAKRHGEALHYLFDIVISMHSLGIDYTKPAVAANGIIEGSLKRPAAEINGTSKRFHSASSQYSSYEFFLFDIEGTTTPISFVKEVLFPYAADGVHSFLSETWTAAETQEDVAALYKQVLSDSQDQSQPSHVREYPAPSTGLVNGPKDQQIDYLVKYVQFNISHDRKIGSLKQLQGHMWRRGYEIGTLKGDLFADIPTTFERIVTAGKKIIIYSSGSREAQKLIFKFSVAGDMSKHISFYFDTMIGNKREKKSYQEIALSLGTADEPSKILFFTDVIEEAQAARAAGVHAVLSVRPGNAPLPESHEFEVLQTFDSIQL